MNLNDDNKRAAGDSRLALRPSEAAERLGVSERWLWTQTKAGRVPHIKLGRSVLYPVEALQAWLRDSASDRQGGPRR